MKSIKKLIPGLLALIFVLAMLPTGALAAAPTGSLTMQNTSGAVKDTSSYSAYRIVAYGAASGSSPSTTIYTNMVLNATYKSAIISSLGGTLSSTSTDNDVLTAMQGMTADQSAALATALDAVGGSVAYSTTNGVFSSMTYGYYLVIETGNSLGDGTVISKPILVSVPGDAANPSDTVVKVKTSTATIEKKIIISSNPYDSSTAAVLDKVNYQSVSTIPTYPANATGLVYYVTDTLSTGLTFDSSSVIVKIMDSSGTTPVTTLAAVTGYTLETSGIGSATFRVTLIGDGNIKTWGNAGDKVLVTYSAALNSSATFGSTGNPNSINLTYTNNPSNYGPGSTFTTLDDTVITYANQLTVTKKDESNNPMTGVDFELYQYDGTDYTIFIEKQTTSTPAGIATFTKLQQGSYMLKETAAPAGYNLVSIPFVVSAKNGTTAIIPNTGITVTQNGNTAALAFKAAWECDNKSIVVTDTGMTITINDTKGFALPGTGGIGTTIFTVTGIVIILLGICLFLVYQKKHRKNEDR